MSCSPLWGAWVAPGQEVRFKQSLAVLPRISPALRGPCPASQGRGLQKLGPPSGGKTCWLGLEAETLGWVLSVPHSDPVPL